MSFDWKKRVLSRFEAQAACYDQHSAIQKHVAHTLAQALPVLPAAPDVLEIGCGTGALTGYLLDTYPAGRFHVTDISPKMVDAARASLPASGRINWSVMDGENPDAISQYDLIIASMVFQWFEAPDRALETLRALLKPSGVLLFSVPSPDSFKEWTSTLAQLSLPGGFTRSVHWPGVFKTEELPAEYGSTLNFLRALKRTGADIPDNHYKSLGYTDLKKACAAADQRYQGRITWRILYGRIESPA